MRNKILTLLAATSLITLMTGATAYALLYDARLEVNIPFAFTVENTTLPAGAYVVSAASYARDLDLLEIKQENGDKAVLFSTFETQPTRRPVRTGLVFDRIGGREFLSEVWLEGTEKGNELMKSSQEVQLEKAGNKVEKHKLPS